MKSFKIDKEYEILCDSESTRSGFRHIAILMQNDDEIFRTKVCYQNRTWESYTFQSVIFRLIEKTNEFSEAKKEKLMKYFRDYRGESSFNSSCNSILGVMAVGELLSNTKKEKNDWNLRMLKAGLGSFGLNIPKNWDSLSEDEKTKRIELVKNEMRKSVKQK